MRKQILAEDVQALLRNKKRNSFSCVQKSGFVNPVADVDRAKGGIVNSVVVQKVSLCVRCFAGQLRIFASVVLLKVQISFASIAT